MWHPRQHYHSLGAFLRVVAPVLSSTAEVTVNVSTTHLQLIALFPHAERNAAVGLQAEYLGHAIFSQIWPVIWHRLCYIAAYGVCVMSPSDMLGSYDVCV